jgi:Family of unknown function (DUF5706)
MSTSHRIPETYYSPSSQASPEDQEAMLNGRKQKGKKNRKEKGVEYGRSAETLFRSAYQTHVGLTAMADGKANIMITINGLVISVLIAAVSPRIDRDEWLLLPTAVLLVTCVSSLIFAVLAVRPRINQVPLTLDKVRRERANILFFGNYVNLPEPDFRQGVLELLKDPERAYDTMARDLYGMGSVMSRKFRLLRHSYDLFMGGLVVGVVALLINYAILVF